MVPEDCYDLFESLTEKQHETLLLAAQHLTSKQIAQQLGLAPVTIDKRIEAVRARLGALPRASLLRAYRQWFEAYERTIDDPIILGESAADRAEAGLQPNDFALAFEDSIAFDARASWDRQAARLRPELKLSSLGIGGKLLVMFGGAVAMMMVAVLSIAFADALMTIFAR